MIDNSWGYFDTGSFTDNYGIHVSGALAEVKPCLTPHSEPWQNYFDISAWTSEKDFYEQFSLDPTESGSSDPADGTKGNDSESNGFGDNITDQELQAFSRRRINEYSRSNDSRLWRKSPVDYFSGKNAFSGKKAFPGKKAFSGKHVQTPPLERPVETPNWRRVRTPNFIASSTKTDGESSPLRSYTKCFTTSPNEKVQRRTQRSHLKWDAPIMLKGTEILACPDTGSEQNILSKDSANKLGVLEQLDPSQSGKFILGNGKATWSLGAIELEMCFSQQPEVLLPCMFHVFETLIRPAILGGVFLRHTETLTKYRQSRLRRRVVHPSSRPEVMQIGYARERFRCFVDAVMVDVHADTGSEMDLVSQRFVRKSSHQAKALQNPMAVQFADGSVGCISHQIFTRFSADLERPKTEWDGKWFYVLDDLPCEILLGNETLDNLDAFNRETSFVMEVLDPDGIQLCTIFWARHLDQKASRLWDKFSTLKAEKRKTNADASDSQDTEASIAFDDPLLTNVDPDFRGWIKDMISGGKEQAGHLHLPARIDLTLLDALDGWETNRRSKVPLSRSRDVTENERQQKYDASREMVLQAFKQATSTTDHGQGPSASSNVGSARSNEMNGPESRSRSHSASMEDQLGPSAPPSLASAGTPPFLSTSLVAHGLECPHPGCNAATFADPSLLNSHMERHTGIRVHYCPFDDCARGSGGEGFEQKYKMIRYVEALESGAIC